MAGLNTLYVGGIWSLGLQIRKTVECFKFCLMGHLSRSMENSAEGDFKCRGPAQEISEGKLFLVRDLETALVIFWQSIWLLSALVQKKST